MTPIFLLAECYGESEAKSGSALVGQSGVELIRQLGESKIITISPVDQRLIELFYRTSDPRHLVRLWANHPYIHRTNVFNFRPESGDLNHILGAKRDGIPNYPALKIPRAKGANAYKPDGNFVRAEFNSELERLGDELIHHNPNIVVCLGNVALWALTGGTGISKIRGTILASTHTVDGFKLLPTYHPASILRQYDNRPIAIADLMKAKRESAYHEIRRPPREIWIEPTLDDIRHFFQTHCRDCDLLSVDTETSGDRITCIGFAPSTTLSIVIPFDDARRSNGSYWNDPSDEARCWGLVKSILEDGSIPKLFQNGAYDIVFLWRSMWIRVLGATEDTMLLHHALQPEALKSLGFLGSIYSDEGAWKDMRKAKTTKRDD